MKLTVSKLNEHIKKVNSLHNEINALAHNSLKLAIELGGILSEVKEELGHGEWLPWVHKNCEFSARTAQRYLSCYDNRNTTGLSFLNLSQVYKVLSDPKQIPESTSTPNAQRDSHLNTPASNRNSVEPPAQKSEWDDDEPPPETPAVQAVKPWPRRLSDLVSTAHNNYIVALKEFPKLTSDILADFEKTSQILHQMAVKIQK